MTSDTCHYQMYGGAEESYSPIKTSFLLLPGGLFLYIFSSKNTSAFGKQILHENEKWITHTVDGIVYLTLLIYCCCISNESFYSATPFCTLLRTDFPKFLNRGEKKYSASILFFFKFALLAFYARFAFCASILGSKST